MYFSNIYSNTEITTNITLAYLLEGPGEKVPVEVMTPALLKSSQQLKGSTSRSGLGIKWRASCHFFLSENAHRTCARPINTLHLSMLSNVRKHMPWMQLWNVAMLELIAKYIQDVSVLRRLLFAAVFLSPALPHYWGLVVEFATAGKASAAAITPEQARVFTENIQSLNASAFDTDETLFKQLLQLETPEAKPLGVPLISSNNTCILCGSNLLLRKDRPALVVLYDDSRGTLPASHFHKNCSCKTCSFTQYYGYYTTGGPKACHAIYNADWQSLCYFVSSKETAVSMEFLRRLDAEIVIGQMSYNQRANIYNYVHNYTSDLYQRYKYAKQHTCMHVHVSMNHNSYYCCLHVGHLTL